MNVLMDIAKVYLGGCLMNTLLLLFFWSRFQAAGDPATSGRNALMFVFGWPLMIYDVLAGSD